MGDGRLHFNFWFAQGPFAHGKPTFGGGGGARAGKLLLHQPLWGRVKGTRTALAPCPFCCLRQETGLAVSTQEQGHEAEAWATAAPAEGRTEQSHHEHSTRHRAPEHAGGAAMGLGAAGHTGIGEPPSSV